MLLTDKTVKNATPKGLNLQHSYVSWLLSKLCFRTIHVSLNRWNWTKVCICIDLNQV